MDDEWVMVIGGFCMPKAAYAAEISLLENSGKKVLFIKDNEDIIGKFRAKKIRKADLVAFSFVDNALRFTADHPGMVKRIFLINPSGLIGRDTSKNLTFRFARQMAEEAYAFSCAVLSNPRLILTIIRVVWGFSSQSLRRLSELRDIASSNALPLLSIIKQYKIEVILLNAYSDRVFPAERIVNTLGKNPFRLVSRWAIFVREGASHNASYIEKPGAIRQIMGW